MNESQREPDLKLSFLAELVRQQYDVQLVTLRRLASDSGKHIFQVQLVNGMKWVLRVTEGQGTATFIDLANLLIFFKQHNYPAERIILTKEQTAIGTVGNWHLLMTTFLVGTPLEYTPTDLLLLGSVVGQLHALGQSLTYSPPQADMLPTKELAFAQQQLSAIAPLVPKQFFAEYELLETALVSLNRGTDLPTTLIHNDCHPANALLTAPGQVTLLDWEGAGRGSAILDVGFLLANCDGKAPWEPLSSVSSDKVETRIQAVMEGYSCYHQLTSDELDYLPDAIRFRSLVFGACNFAETIAHHDNATFSQWWWKRYCMAEEIAGKAREYIEQPREHTSE